MMWTPNERKIQKSNNGIGTRLIRFEKNEISKISLSENLREYCLNTTIHGLKYAGTVSLSIVERGFFIVSFFLVVTLSIYFISNVYQKWQSTPIIIGLNPIATNIKDIPFPAVTICNMNQARRWAAERVKPNSLEQDVLNSICSLDGEFNTSSYVGKWSNVRKMLLSSTQPCDQMLQGCRYAQKIQKCMHMFQPVLTDEGLCCTFNSVDQAHMLQHEDKANAYIPEADNPFEPIEWTPEGGFVGSITNASFPRNIAGIGAHMGLTVVLDANVSDYYCSSTSSYGFKLLLHNPTETPKMADFASYVMVGTENRIIVTPRISDASFLIRKFVQGQRQCVFANEANLSYFKTYSRNNCEMECEARLIQENCGCVLYYMPKLTEDVKICSQADAHCYEEIRTSIAFTSNTSLMCTCLPGCFEISYAMDISTADLCVGKFQVREELLTQNDSYARHNVALVYIFFKDTYFRSFSKGELFGFTDFLSNIGGLLGLFLGFSIISVAEVLYFLTLRPYFAKRRERKSQAAAAPVIPRDHERDFHVFYNHVMPQKDTNGTLPQARYKSQTDGTTTTRDWPSELKLFITSRVAIATKWVENAFRLQEPKKVSTFPFYE
ncbi:pickpocket protein 28-like [Uranotaenia lowii]|uniref:pickpocket protein 28-like n=1 Tax=Uranotaenia lowii TaxID=190385 RepID=UPI00247A9F07|nr:pickpocket protein 28-like [Uranotaenia lowii]